MVMNGRGKAHRRQKEKNRHRRQAGGNQPASPCYVMFHYRRPPLDL
jgi:hypothetical protein